MHTPLYVHLIHNLYWKLFLPQKHPLEHALVQPSLCSTPQDKGGAHFLSLIFLSAAEYYIALTQSVKGKEGGIQVCMSTLLLKELRLQIKIPPSALRCPGGIWYSPVSLNQHFFAKYFFFAWSEADFLSPLVHPVMSRDQ